MFRQVQSIQETGKIVFAFYGKGDYPELMTVSACLLNRNGGHGPREEYGARPILGVLSTLKFFCSRTPILFLAIGILASTAPAQKVGSGTTSGSSSGGTTGGSGGTGHLPPPTTTNSGNYGAESANPPSNNPSNMNMPSMGWGDSIPMWMNEMERSAPLFDPIQKQEDCLRWTVAGVQGVTVSLARLAVPKDARKNFENACASLRDKHLPQAEEQVRKAIGEYPNFVAAWVMLGQILTSQQQPDKAREACSHALNADANYVPAYLCMADITYGAESWDEVLDYSTRALALDPVHDAYAFFYSAAALYNKGDLARAENNAAHAVEIDRLHRDPEMVFLLAKIHQAQGAASAAVAELHEYLKLAPDSKDSNLAKKNLADLDGTSKSVIVK
jgi:TolA-binding protein